MKLGELNTQAKHIRDVLLRRTFDQLMSADTGYHRGPFWREAEQLGLPGARGERVGGVYFIAEDWDRDVLYIGKSTTGSIDRDVWSKLGTPAGTSTPGRRCFPKTSWFENHDIDEDVRKALFNGEFYVDAITIEPLECAALYEIYLQTFCYLREGRLPPLNARIG